uniref:Capsid protein n=1 Tax=Lygus hesperus TaxID=30085 RepID=A0A0A9Y6T1_LYGHE
MNRSRGKHRGKGQFTWGTDFFSCLFCSYRGSRGDDISTHYAEVHSTEVRTNVLNFSTNEDFKAWKTYVLSQSKYTYEWPENKGEMRCNPTIGIAWCNQGVQHFSETPMRKIRGVCPASIRSRLHVDGTISVDYISTHLGHNHSANGTDLPDQSEVTKCFGDLESASSEELANDSDHREGDEELLNSSYSENDAEQEQLMDLFECEPSEIEQDPLVSNQMDEFKLDPVDIQCVKIEEDCIDSEPIETEDISELQNDPQLLEYESPKTDQGNSISCTLDDSDCKIKEEQPESVIIPKPPMEPNTWWVNELSSSTNSLCPNLDSSEPSVVEQQAPTALEGFKITDNLNAECNKQNTSPTPEGGNSLLLQLLRDDSLPKGSSSLNIPCEPPGAEDHNYCTNRRASERLRKKRELRKTFIDECGITDENKQKSTHKKQRNINVNILCNNRTATGTEVSHLAINKTKEISVPITMSPESTTERRSKTTCDSSRRRKEWIPQWVEKHMQTHTRSTNTDADVICNQEKPSIMYGPLTAEECTISKKQFSWGKRHIGSQTPAIFNQMWNALHTPCRVYAAIGRPKCYSNHKKKSNSSISQNQPKEPGINEQSQKAMDHCHYTKMIRKVVLDAPSVVPSSTICQPYGLILDENKYEPGTGLEHTLFDPRNPKKLKRIKMKPRVKLDTIAGRYIKQRFERFRPLYSDGKMRTMTYSFMANTIRQIMEEDPVHTEQSLDDPSLDNTPLEDGGPFRLFKKDDTTCPKEHGIPGCEQLPDSARAPLPRFTTDENVTSENWFKKMFDKPMKAHQNEFKFKGPKSVNTLKQPGPFSSEFITGTDLL